MTQHDENLDQKDFSLPRVISLNFFLTAIWLSHGQLWTILEGTASLTRS